jgi:hypothetical protein
MHLNPLSSFCGEDHWGDVNVKYFSQYRGKEKSQEHGKEISQAHGKQISRGGIGMTQTSFLDIFIRYDSPSKVKTLA